MIANPDYKDDDTLHARCNPCTHVGFDLWQVKSGTLFDDIYIGDSLEEAKAAAEAWTTELKGEKEMNEKQEAEKKAAEEKEAAEKKAAEDAKAAEEKKDEKSDDDDE